MKKVTDENGSCRYLSKTFLKIFDDYMEERLKTQRSRREYTYVIFSLCNQAKQDFLELCQGDVREFLLTDKNGNRRSAPDGFRMRIIKSICRYIDTNADRYSIAPRYLEIFTELCPVPDDPYFHPTDFPNLEDVNRIFAYLKAENEMATFIACALALRCGLLIHEIVELEKSHFFQDVNGNYGIRIRLSGLADRFVKLPEDVAELIILYIQKRPEESTVLLLNKRKRPMNIRILQNRLRTACLTCGIEPFTFNSLRNLGTTYMIKGGATLEKVAYCLDVKERKWFFRYDRVVRELEDAAVDYSHIRIIV